MYAADIKCVRDTINLAKASICQMYKQDADIFCGFRYKISYIWNQQCALQRVGCTKIIEQCKQEGNTLSSKSK